MDRRRGGGGRSSDAAGRCAGAMRGTTPPRIARPCAPPSTRRGRCLRVRTLGAGRERSPPAPLPAIADRRPVKSTFDRARRPDRRAARRGRARPDVALAGWTGHLWRRGTRPRRAG